MKAKPSSPNLLSTESWKLYLSYLDLTLKALRASRADPLIIKFHTDLIRSAKTKGTGGSKVESKRSRQFASNSFVSQELEEGEIRGLTDERLREMISSRQFSRKTLTLIAKVRFGLPVGELSRLQNRVLLEERLLTLLNNLETQLNLGRFASKEP